MPLFSISPNIQESPTTPRKRTHEDFVDTPSQLAIGDPSHSENLGKLKSAEMSVPAINPPQLPTLMATMDATPGSSPAALTEAGSSPAMRKSLSPNKTPLSSPSASGSTASQPTQSDLLSAPTAQKAQGAKRKPSTIEEKLNATKRQKLGVKATERLEKEEAKGAEKAKKEKEAEEKRQAKEAKAAEKAKKEAEAAEKRQKKEAEAAEKAKKKAADEAAKAAKIAEKEKRDAAKEAAKRKKEEAKERQQSMLAGFVQRAANAPPKTKKAAEQTAKPSVESDAADSSPKAKSKSEKSAYDRLFQPFFVKPDVMLAPQPFEMDDETKDIKSRILDQYIRGERGEFNPKPFNPTETFNLAFTRKRGIIPPSVKSIMESLHSEAEQAGTKTESQTKKLAENAQERLNAITTKYLSFYEDVRPPYFGTVTTPIEATKLRFISRRPVGKALPLNYDYDSEAEWVEDDGEDLDDEDDDDDSHDGDGEMEDFLDDSEDQPTTARPTFLGEKEPVSTGICFEDETRLGPCPTTYKYQLEFLLDTLDHSGIDPFSTSYWPAPAKRATTKSAVTSTPAPPTSMPPPDVPTGASALASSTGSSLQALENQNIVPKDVFDEFRQAIISDELKEFTKGTIIEMLAKKFPSCTKTQVKVTLDKVAHRVSVPGAKKNVKQWALLPAYAL
ncbi:chromatin assembly factor 1 subunit A-domain-containing protein [Daldinia vernicosa]|uniref:chromatin assembly factor 1 subunit A-domain-containing protein n=1 Tax=Daldinia vernicosa TaxID=114800 RepID=UPI00200892D2|nr:chromatin assembly factor 1 subunit A-domain-containing protein [Daldinia vernicosa]KAI0851603.1 chromatin assembly factor 1 subunit A-domain-containing protein [Daldinia vernicosa]